MSNLMTQHELVAQRKYFFEKIVAYLEKEPQEVDLRLRQSEFFRPIEREGMIFDPELGDLWIKVKPSFYGKTVSLAYSFWQYGNVLKAAVIAYDNDVEWAMQRDGSHGELAQLFGQNRYYSLHTQHNETYYEWQFDATNLYDSYQNMENYILAFRHMHFRVMRLIHDNCLNVVKQEADQEEAREQEQRVQLGEDLLAAVAQAAVEGNDGPHGTTDIHDMLARYPSLSEDPFLDHESTLLLPELSADEEAILSDVIDALNTSEDRDALLAKASLEIDSLDDDELDAVRQHFVVRTQLDWPFPDREPRQQNEASQVTLGEVVVNAAIEKAVREGDTKTETLIRSVLKDKPKTSRQPKPEKLSSGKNQ